MSYKLIGIATLFAAGSILVAGNPTLGAQGVDTQASANASVSDQDLRCARRRCGGRCASRRCATRRCARRCATRYCATRYCATRYCATRHCA
jgi:hypothetical protein